MATLHDLPVLATQPRRCVFRVDDGTCMATATWTAPLRAAVDELKLQSMAAWQTAWAEVAFSGGGRAWRDLQGFLARAALEFFEHEGLTVKVVGRVPGSPGYSEEQDGRVGVFAYASGDVWWCHFTVLE